MRLCAAFFQTDPFALGLFASAGLPCKLFAEQPGGGVASVLGCTDLGKFIGQACDFRRKARDRLLRTGHARVEVGLEPLKLRERACFAVPVPCASPRVRSARL